LAYAFFLRPVPADVLDPPQQINCLARVIEKVLLGLARHYYIDYQWAFLCIYAIRRLKHWWVSIFIFDASGALFDRYIYVMFIFAPFKV